MLPSASDVLIPLAIGLTAMLLSWRPWAKRAARGRWGPPVALAGGFLAAYRPIIGQIPGFPPVGATGWLFYVGVLAGIVGLLDGQVRLPRWVRALLVLASAAASLWLILRLKLTIGSWRPLAASAWIAALAASTAAWWWRLELASARPASAAAGMALIAFSCALLLSMSYAISYGRLCLALGSATAALAAASAVNRQAIAAPGANLVWAVLLQALLAAGYFFAELPGISYVCVVCAAALLGPCRIPGMGGFLRGQRALVRWGMLAALLLGALTWAAMGLYWNGTE